MPRAFVALLSAIALAAAQSPASLGSLALVALVPWLCATRRMGALEATAVGGTVGTAYGCLVAPWIPEALRSLGSSWPESVFGLLLVAAWAKLPLFAGLGLITQRLRSRSAAFQIVAFAAAVGVGEWILGTWRLGVPVALLGHSQLASLGVAQLAVVGGVPLLSAGVASINGSVSLALTGGHFARRFAAAAVGAWLATGAFGLPLAEAVRPDRPTTDVHQILIVQPDLGHAERWDPQLQMANLRQVARYTGRALPETKSGVAAVVWPENMLTSRFDEFPVLAEELESWVERWETSLITGLVRSARGSTPGRYRSSVLWLEPGGIQSAVDKVYAIPLLESGRVLIGSNLLSSLFGRAARWPKVEEAESGGPLRGRFIAAPVLCYEVLFPGLVAERRPATASAILNLADDSWVSAEGATRQLANYARFRAIEQRSMLIRLAHGGLSTVVDEYGRVERELPIDTWAHAVVELRSSAPPGWSEQTFLFALPLLAGAGVWWSQSLWMRERRHGTSPREEP